MFRVVVNKNLIKKNLRRRFDKSGIAEESGQALIELILAIAIATVVLASLASGVFAVREGFARSDKKLVANNLLQKEIEAIRSIKEFAWNSIATSNTYYTRKSPTGNNWEAILGTIEENSYTRGFTIANVCHQSPTSTSPIVNCTSPGAIVDPSMKQIVATVSWSFLGTQSVSSTFYISRYFNNQAWMQTIVSDFNTGILNNTQVTSDVDGEVKLAPASGGNWNSPQVVALRDFAGGIADAQDIFVVNNRAYIVTLTRSGADFFIYDVSNPDIPTPLGSRDLGANAYAVVVSGNYAYVATSHDSRELTVMDVSDPSNPVLAGTHFNAPTGSDGRGVAVSGSTAYLITNNNTTAPGYEFYSINVSNPAAPTQIGGLNLAAAARDIFVSGSYAYIASTLNSQELQIVNITNPASPTLAGSYNSPGTSDGQSVYIVGTTAYMTDARLNILDVTNPASISSIGFYNAPGLPFAVFVSGNFAFLGHNEVGSQFKVIDTTNPASPTLFGSANLGGTGFGVFVVGDYAYLATSNDTAEFQVIRGGAGGGFQTLGTFESATFDAGAVAGFNYLTMTTNKPPSTNLRLQIATNTDASTWNFVGPDGTSSSYFDLPDAIPLNQIANRYFRFKAFLYGDGSATPTLFDATVNYSQ
ncbi:MAG: hypothetical protein Q8O75_01700 [bacterium]|nr:hypothetical protein [bacterium]